MVEIDFTMLPNEVDYLFNKFDSNSNQVIGFEEFTKEMEGQNIRMSAIPNL
jgi:Ca2+-binding EF-hand superfamily protein